MTDDGARGLDYGSAAMVAAGERDFNKLLMSKVRFIVKLQAAWRGHRARRLISLLKAK